MPDVRLPCPYCGDHDTLLFDPTPGHSESIGRIFLGDLWNCCACGRMFTDQAVAKATA